MIANRSVMVIPPGETIKELLLDKGMDIVQFAEKMGVSIPYAENLLEGKAEITPYIATKLEEVLGVPDNFWNRLEAIYRSELSQINNGKERK